MGNFEEAVSHSRATDIVSPSPAVTGKLGSNPMLPAGQSGAINSNHFASPVANARVSNKAGVIAHSWANATDGIVPEEQVRGGQPVNSVVKGTDVQAYEPSGEAYGTIAAARGQLGEISPCWNDAQGGKLGVGAGQMNKQTK